MELELLKILSKKQDYNRYKSIVNSLILSEEVNIIFKDMEEYYNTHTEIDWNDFESWFLIFKHPNFKIDKNKIYKTLFDRIKSYISSSTEQQIIEALITREYAGKIADLAGRIAEGDGTNAFEDINDEYKAWEKELNKANQLEKWEVTDDIKEVLNKTIGVSGYEWRLEELNVSLGPCRPAYLYLIAARPNAGKTSLLAHEITYIARQLKEDEYVLWFNNEQEGNAVKYRIIQAAIKKDSVYMRTTDSATIADLYDKSIKGKTKIKIIDKGDLDVHSCETWIEKYNPKVILFDQLWKAHGFEKNSINETDRVTKLYNWAREIAKTYNVPFIAVHQAASEAEGEMWIQQNQLYGNKTGAPGEIDVSIMLGKSNEPHLENMRYLYFPKNKSPGGPRFDPSRREGRYELEFNKEICEFKGGY